MKYIDPDGRDIRGMLRGTVKIALAVGEVIGGISMVVGAAAGEYFSVSLATSAAVVLGITDVGVIQIGRASCRERV